MDRVDAGLGPLRSIFQPVELTGMRAWPNLVIDFLMMGRARDTGDSVGAEGEAGTEGESSEGEVGQACRWDPCTAGCSTTVRLSPAGRLSGMRKTRG